MTYNGWTPRKPSDITNRNGRMLYLHNPGCQCEHCTVNVDEPSECPDCREFAYSAELGVCDNCEYVD